MNSHKYYKIMYDAISRFRTSRFNLFQKFKSNLLEASLSHSRLYSLPTSGEAGSGAGKGGGAGGTVREAGGGMGKYAAANEEGYFYEKQKRQLRKLKEKKKSASRKSDDSRS